MSKSREGHPKDHRRRCRDLVGIMLGDRAERRKRRTELGVPLFEREGTPGMRVHIGCPGCIRGEDESSEQEKSVHENTIC